MCPTWGRGPGSHPGQGQAITNTNTTWFSGLTQCEGNSLALNIIIFIIIEDINIKNSIICVININISIIV
jgi:hypothetical protein